MHFILCNCDKHISLFVDEASYQSYYCENILPIDNYKAAQPKCDFTSAVLIDIFDFHDEENFIMKSMQINEVFSAMIKWGTGRETINNLCGGDDGRRKLVVI